MAFKSRHRSRGQSRVGVVLVVDCCCGRSGRGCHISSRRQAALMFFQFRTWTRRGSTRQMPRNGLFDFVWRLQGNFDVVWVVSRASRSGFQFGGVCWQG